MATGTVTLIDCATSFSEAVRLKSIMFTDVAEALVSLFSRVGSSRDID